jgi:23S rRNA pseudouridine955/2504/2580 synthase
VTDSPNKDRGPGQRPAVRRVKISADDDGQRVDNYLMRVLKGVPKTRIYKALRKGEVRVDGKRVRPEHRLERDQEVRIPPLALPTQAPAPAPSAGLREMLADRVLYEDEHLLIIDKPSGLAVHGGSGLKLGLIEAMRRLRPEELRLELVHRLDRATSGCLMLAKRPAALRELHRQLREGEVTKTYLALLRGRLPEDKVDVDAALDRRTTRSGRRQVEVDDEAGRASRTSFRLLERYRRVASLVEVGIETGRTHQIRVHAQHIGHEVAGDLRYGDLRFNREMRRFGLRRLFLHARSLSFIHPATAEPMRVDATMDDDLRAVINALEGGA